MGDPALMERLQALLESPAGGEGAPSLAHLESSLTDGYARALALEAERARVAKSIGVLAADDSCDAEARTRELSSLSRRLAGTDRELEDLRRTLQQLRSRTTALRSALAPART